MHMRPGIPFASVIRLAAGVGLAAATLLGAAYAAGAKGPVSVTIAGPGIARPIELMESGDPELMNRLMLQTGLWYGGGPRLQEAPPGALGPAYTLTWVNAGPPGEHLENRTIYQLIYLEAESGPLIHTPAQQGLVNWGAGVIGWYPAPDGLRDTLTEFGVPTQTAFSFRIVLPAGLAVAMVLAGWLLSRAARSATDQSAFRRAVQDERIANPDRPAQDAAR